MSRSRIRRALAPLAVAAMLAGLLMSAAVAPAAAGTAHKCDYTFPAGGGSVTDIAAGQVFCGGPGNDFVSGTNAGTFYGGDGIDSVWINTGTFYGGAGIDAVLERNDGTFYGQDGDDHVSLGSSGTNNGTFYGQDGNDFVNYNYGTVYGQSGDDIVVLQEAGTFSGGGGDDVVFSYVGGTCTSASGC